MRFTITLIDDGQTEAAGDYAAVESFNERILADGHLVYAAGVAATGSASIIDNRGEAPATADDPFAKMGDSVAGLWIWEVPDRSTAFDLAYDAGRACNRRIEVRATLGAEG